jgi:flagellar biosynthesis protein FlhB
MAEGSDQEKTESATPKKREQSREEGQVAQTRELPSALVLVATLLVFSLLAGWMWETLIEIFQRPFAMIGQIEVSPASAKKILGATAIDVALLIAPLLLVILTVGVASNVVQIGLLVSGKALMPKGDRINPLEGFKRIFSSRGLVDMFKAIFKIGLIGYLAVKVVMAESDQLLNLTNHGVINVLTFILMLSYRIFVRVAMLLLVLAALDYAFQLYDHEKKLKMTKQEVKDEHKQSEGDPKIKARIRSLQREMSMRRMMQEVPKADVVITNPTHVAVAIKFDPTTDPAPRMIAKGQGHVAARIREQALLHGVPILERPELARALNKAVKLGNIVPPQLYQALAEILAYVYNLKERRSM